MYFRSSSTCVFNILTNIDPLVGKKVDYKSARKLLNEVISFKTNPCHRQVC